MNIYLEMPQKSLQKSGNSLLRKCPFWNKFAFITYDLMLRRLLNIVKIYTLSLLFGILYVKNSLRYMSVKSQLPDLKFKFQRTSELDG